MIDLKKIIGEQNGEAWVKFGKNFELLIAYLPRRKLEELRTQHTDLKKRREALFLFVVRDWRGLTVGELAELTRIDNACLEDFAKEVPFSQEGLLVLADAVYDLDEFIRMQCMNHILFRPPDWENQLKNSGSGETLSSPHGKSLA